MIDDHYEDSLTEKQVYFWNGKDTKGAQSRVTIDILPDVALLTIFDFYVDEEDVEVWHTLVHVCRKWRNIVFGSPRRLHLRLSCKAGTPVRELLNIWPPLPIAIEWFFSREKDEDNINAALEHNDRISHLTLINVPILQMEKVLGAMQQPFPALIFLRLLQDDFWDGDEAMRAVPASFLGGSAPQLRVLTLQSIPLPGLPDLLLSATYLDHLYLSRIPPSGYMSPEETVACLSALTRLKTLVIGFSISNGSPPDGQWIQRPPPQTRALLPALNKLHFLGFSEYSEDFFAQINAPLLHQLKIDFFPQQIYHTSRLTEFIRRTPKFKARGEAPGSLYELDHFGLSATLS